MFIFGCVLIQVFFSAILSESSDASDRLHGQKQPDSANESQAFNSPDASNVVFGELGGNGIVASVNYERFLTHHLALKVGCGPVPAYGVSVPCMVSAFVGPGPSRLELGGGYTFTPVWPEPYGQSGGVLTMTIGYRYQPREGRIMLRAAWTPYFDVPAGVLKGSAGVGFGYCF